MMHDRRALIVCIVYNVFDYDCACQLYLRGSEDLCMVITFSFCFPLFWLVSKFFRKLRIFPR